MYKFKSKFINSKHLKNIQIRIEIVTPHIAYKALCNFTTFLHNPPFNKPPTIIHNLTQSLSDQSKTETLQITEHDLPPIQGVAFPLNKIRRRENRSKLPLILCPGV